VTAVTGTTDIDPCPYCGENSGVQPITGISPKVQAWSCSVCTTQWAITTVRPYFDRLAATVEQLSTTRSVLRQVITMADDAATLPDKELRDRLLVLADRARLVNSQNPAYLIPRPAAG
jgi:ribosomal protein L37AE/L43A